MELCQGDYSPSDEGQTDTQVYQAHSLYGLKGRWIRYPDPLLASKWKQLLDPQLSPLLNSLPYALEQNLNLLLS